MGHPTGRARPVAATTVTGNVRTVPNIELLDVGVDWHAMTGDVTFTPAHLVAAIESQQDPDVRTPIIKLGHTDPRFDGEPALGRVVNLRVTNNGQTLVGDLAGMPEWLAEAMPTMYPRRSIEGLFDVTTHGGVTWPFQLTGVALLGTMYPAVSTLEDVKALWAGTPNMVSAEPDDFAIDHPVAASGVRVVKGDDMDWLREQRVAAAAKAPAAQRIKVAASSYQAVDVGDIIDAFYDMCDETPGMFWWWVREVRISPLELIVDDDDGDLYRVPVTITADFQIQFGTAVEVAVQYVDIGSDGDESAPVAATARIPATPGQIVAARNANPVAARRRHERPPVTATAPDRDTGRDTGPPGGPDVQLTPAQLAALGLDETATDDQISAALDTRLAAPGGDGGEGTGAGTGEGEGGSETETDIEGEGGTPTETETGTEGEQSRIAAALAALPPGLTIVPTATLDEVRAGARAGAELAARAAQQDRERRVDAAIGEGRILKAERDAWLGRLAGPDGASMAAYLAQAPVLIPQGERGYAGGSETETDTPTAYGGVLAEAVRNGRRRTAAAGRVRVVGD